MTGRGYELILRTGSQATSWDRRYLGPTILRYRAAERLLVGAIARTVSTDAAARQERARTRPGRAFALFRHRFVDGFEQLDGTTVGFLPVVRHGVIDYLPYEAVSIETSPTRIVLRSRMIALHVRGVHACRIEALALLQNNVPGMKPKEYSRPRMRPAKGFDLTRVVTVGATRCRIEDAITGDLAGKRILFSVRGLPSASIRINGMQKVNSSIGWGSDGRQALDLYSAQPSGSEIRYTCEIEPV
jgi:hypothetical protein